MQDAIAIARRLGVRYLWVDALCILQGTDEAKLDWQRESPRMRDVYGNAFLTIVAAPARTIHGGIFAAGNPPKIPHCRIPYKSKCTPGIEGHVFLGFAERPRDRSEEPLYHRAWTLQERILSSRALICTRDQLCWECAGAKWTESGEFNPPISSARLEAQPNQGNTWNVIVRDYSSRDLTYSMDKLPRTVRARE
ncbi:uncharacterized protein PV07_08850 [Cladophialophora immunda]|uniref:Heterokaryon incompatibility domain-containing protein n=1 Tax=Cladophialophora immunda TaxID=569365 RepID=A0A0D2CQ11_9EURO|nr:uncharacterized protein PV07_08850 [Cladophialophora immunda]KIW25689.1 hypothetical protein PV07_08850 [Cladophialophora immunda]